MWDHIINIHQSELLSTKTIEEVDHLDNDTLTH